MKLNLYTRSKFHLILRAYQISKDIKATLGILTKRTQQLGEELKKLNIITQPLKVY